MPAKNEHNKMKRYQQLDSLLRNPRGYTIEELLYRLDDDISERTLKKDLATLRKDFGVEFYEDPVGQRHYEGRKRLHRYKDTDFSLFQQVDEDIEVINKCLSRLYLLNDSLRRDPRAVFLRYFLSGLKDGFEDACMKMRFDGNDSLKGIELIDPIMEAIVRKHPLRLSYRSFKKEIVETNFHPYHLRQFNGRWFVFGWSEEQQKVYNFPLDRITEVRHLSKEYIPSDRNFDDYFKDIVGVTNYEDAPVERVVLRVKRSEYAYIRNKKLHPSQREIPSKSDRDFVVLEIDVKENMELLMLLFSYNSAIEVLAPKSLRDKIRDRVGEMAKMYEV